MYETLIEALRKVDEYDSGYAKLMYDAADAIGDLQKQLQKSEEDNINLTGWLAEEHAKHLWIPVTERLPEKEDEAVIVWEKQGFALIDWRHDNKWAILDNNYGIATHWMPLPEPPKEES